MLYRRFGRTELQMPVFSCGGMRYQFKWQDVAPDEVPNDQQANLEATIRRSFELGMYHIETARGYGSSEMQLGNILPKLPREKLIAQTKVAPVADPNEFRKTFETSLSYLKLDYVDLLGLHGINDTETFEDALRCLDVVRSLQEQGKVRHVGFSTHGSTEIIIKAIATNQFDYVNLHWYYINQLNWSAIAAAAAHDMGVFIISPTNKGGNLHEPPARLRELCAPLSPVVFNDLFCLSHSQVHTLSIGAAKPTDFDEHLKTLAWIDRADEILPPIIHRLEQAAIERLGEDWFKRWHVGLPSVDETPGRLNLHTVIWLRNLAIAYDLVDYAKMRYNLLGQASHWFPGARVSEIDLEALRPVLQDSPFRDRILDVLREADQLLGGETVKRLSQQ
ncbi:MAG: aldo/keto reductase [Leptolyngbya sp. UWPOB_LEPTO1]|uniref:aldo/keto reductase n=1 Tax=Leptolyngbya sp. UWPOB_LEPTO1 TaxID=2815653 RepID=UPI001ACBCB85|nr:aldo/keto reductase [Leptolyngbya sp. UWPOB_LEPTO1]MBN8563024.1 aldo/keto reductase [Leptolyngbya sp. UWPOB_LEPTO1]